MRGTSQKKHTPLEVAKVVLFCIVGLAVLMIAGHFSIEYTLPMLYQSWMIGF